MPWTRSTQLYKELPRVRKDLGQIPLVTPTSQIVGIQTVNNVLFDDENERYKMITAQVKDLCYGLYGKTAVPINPEVQKKALKGYERGEEPITCRPAEVLEPELAKSPGRSQSLAADIDDEILYAIYPVTGKKFLKWKYGKEPVPDEVKPRTLEDVKKMDELVKKAKAGLLIEPPENPPEKTEHVRKFNVFVEGDYFEVEVDEPDGPPMVSYAPPAAAPAAPVAAPAAAPGPETFSPCRSPQTGACPAAAAVAGTPLRAPMPGMIVSVKKNVGDTVEEGETVVVLEAMKMENALPAPASGTIKAINVSSGRFRGQE